MLYLNYPKTILIFIKTIKQQYLQHEKTNERIKSYIGLLSYDYFLKKAVFFYVNH